MKIDRTVNDITKIATELDSVARGIIMGIPRESAYSRLYYARRDLSRIIAGLGQGKPKK